MRHYRLNSYTLSLTPFKDRSRPGETFPGHKISIIVTVLVLYKGTASNQQMGFHFLLLSSLDKQCMYVINCGIFLREVIYVILAISDKIRNNIRTGETAK